jgi:hypothetical protein
MSLLIRRLNMKHLLTLLLVLSIALLAACSSSSSDSTSEPATEEMEHEEDMEEMEHDEDMEHEEGEMEHGERVPNDGAVIRILSPEDEATFSEGTDIVIEVDVEGFALGEDGQHWHVYVDGTSWLMVVGGDTSDVLRGIEPGDHEVEVVLANGQHQDLEEGDTIHITVE